MKIHSPEELLTTEIKKMGIKDGVSNVFTKYLEIMANALGAEFDSINRLERLKRYEEIKSGMDDSTVSDYAKLCYLTGIAFHDREDDPCDILGKIYHDLAINNEWRGQFFSPDSVSRMMGMMINPTEQNIPKSNYVTINEPTCGSGSIVIGTVWAMKTNNFDYKTKSLFVAQDIDIKCVWMAYIQFCLYGIPAVVIHGNTLTMEEWSKWYTPNAIKLMSTYNRPAVGAIAKNVTNRKE